MKKNILFMLLFIGVSSIAYFLGLSNYSGVSAERFQKVADQNRLLKKQMDKINTILLEKNKEYLLLNKQLIALDKELSQQYFEEAQVIDELSQLVNENLTASNGSSEPKLIGEFHDNIFSDEEPIENQSLDQSQYEPAEDSPSYVDKHQQLYLSPKRKMPPSAFRTALNVNIIDDQYQIQETWVEGTSFTAREKYGEYYKISGYFVNKKWTAAKNLLFVPIQNSIRR